MLLQFSQEIAVDAGAFLYGDKCLGIDAVYDMQQVFFLVFGKAYAQYVHVLAGIGAGAFPVGNTASQLFENLPADFGLVAPGENQHLHADVLLMHLVDHDSRKTVVDHGIDGHGRGEQEEEDGVEEEIESQRELAYREAAAPLAHAKSHDIQTAAAAAAGKNDAVACAGENAAQQACGEIIIDDGIFRDRQQTVDQRIACGADQSFENQRLAQRFVGKEQNGDVEQEIKNTGNIRSPKADAGIVLQQCSGQLAETHGAAGIEIHGCDELGNGNGSDQFAHDGGEKAEPAVAERTV